MYYFNIFWSQVNPFSNLHSLIPQRLDGMQPGGPHGRVDADAPHQQRDGSNGPQENGQDKGRAELVCRGSEAMSIISNSYE